MKPAILISTLARYQTDFWIPVAQALDRAGYRTALLCFDDPSEQLARQARIGSYNAFTLGGDRAQPDQGALEDVLRRTLGCNLALALSHERLAFGLRDGTLIAAKLARSLNAASRAIEDLGKNGRSVVVVQELGGFASVIGTYLAARTSAVDNLFIEPSFYRGRFFVTRNSFAAPRMSEWTAEPELDPDSVIYLRALQKTRAIVIPVKDRHHYRRAWSKLSNARNVVRLGEKIYEKYWRHQRHEFGYIGHHVLSHLRMAANSAHLRKAYAALDSVSPFIYYPLHVPADVALTIRAPAYVDQLALVDYLARNLPTPYKLVIKEHPAQIGALDIARIRELLRRHDNLALLSPHTNNYDVLAQCTVVVSVNSKAGAEALLMRKPTVVLGDAFYARDELVTRAAHLDDVPAAIDEVLRAPRLPSERVVEAFFSNVWRQTFPGELYTGSAEGQETFANSLHRAIIAQ